MDRIFYLHQHARFQERPRAFLRRESLFQRKPRLKKFNDYDFTINDFNVLSAGHLPGEAASMVLKTEHGTCQSLFLAESLAAQPVVFGRQVFQFMG